MRKVEYWDGWNKVYGTFHEWGTGIGYKRNSRDSFIMTKGIIEREDGRVEMISPDDITFIEEEVKSNMLEKFKLGEIGVKVFYEKEHNQIVKLYEDMFPDGDNYCEDYDCYPIMRVDNDDNNCLNGYQEWSKHEFDIIDFDKFKEELEYK